MWFLGQVSFSDTWGCRCETQVYQLLPLPTGPVGSWWGQASGQASPSVVTSSGAVKTPHSDYAGTRQSKKLYLALVISCFSVVYRRITVDYHCFKQRNYHSSCKNIATYWYFLLMHTTFSRRPFRISAFNGLKWHLGQGIIFTCVLLDKKSSEAECSPPLENIRGVATSLPGFTGYARVSSGELGLGTWSVVRLARRLSSLRRSSMVWMVNLKMQSDFIR